jgi:N-acetylmuramoyl-L-alanine amidase
MPARLNRLKFLSAVGSCLGLSLLLLCPQVAAAGTFLTGMRLGVTSERTRVVLEFRSPAYSHQLSMVADSLLILRLKGVRPAAGVVPLTTRDGLFGGSRMLCEKGPETVLRIRLRAPARAEAFRVLKGDGRPDRLVIDITRAPERPTPAPAQTPSAPKSAPAKSDQGPRVVVIDPGHGGNDPGAMAKGMREKDVCLDVSRRLAARLNLVPGFRAVLTRDDDRLIPLRERLRLAERQNADLFVSVHVNAAKSRAARGVEVFFLSIGAASDEASRETARLENEADPDYVIDEDESLKNLPFMVNLRQSDTLLRSSRAAEVLLDLLTSRKLAEARGVKQAGFAVLKSYQVPSVLVELGFISSTADRNKLKTPGHRESLAQALSDGVRRYFESYAPQHPPGAGR